MNPVIAVLGGTGQLGGGLARRWARAGYRVVIGSRSAERAAASAAELGAFSGMTNTAAAAAAEIVLLAVPFSQQREILDEVKPALAGKILIDATVPLVPPKVMRVQLPPEGSAAAIAQGILGESVRVVSAFHNVAAALLHEEQPLDCDVLVFGDDKDARATVIGLVTAAGLRGFHGGSIANSAAAEALTSVLIFINKHYSAHAGIRLTGVR
jgi:hypothetical protein